jgi:hypothetical protein
LGVVDGQEKESAVGGEPFFQHQRVPVGVRSQEIAEGLKCNDSGCRKTSVSGAGHCLARQSDVG